MLKVGIVGLPNVGKSTLFNALTKAGAAVAPYPFTTIDRNLGIASVPDERLEHIAAIVRPEKLVPTTIEFVDIAGLVKGASQGEGLGNQFLGHIRDVDAICMVVRCFSAPDVPHSLPSLNPGLDIEVVALELALADLAAVERRLEKQKPLVRAGDKEAQEELKVLLRLKEALGRGEKARKVALNAKEKEMVQPLSLLTSKPLLYAANVDEAALPHGGPLADEVRRIAAQDGDEVLVICAQVEAELADWAPDEAQAYRQELGLADSGLDRLVAACYSILDLVTFFTTTGGKEVRAWTVRRGTPVVEAAGIIHTDMQRGFIRAEVVSYDDLIARGSFQVVREVGLLRVEGRDYVVRDGDIIHVRFSP